MTTFTPFLYAQADGAGVLRDDDFFYERCRRAMLRLTANLTHASQQHEELAPFLMEAMSTATDSLVSFGDERELLLLEQWLDEEPNVANHEHTI